MTSTNTVCNTPAISSPKSVMTCRETLTASSALAFQPEEQAGCFAWDGSSRPSTASQGKSTKYVKRETWLLQRSDGLYFHGIKGSTLEWTAQPEAAWSCLSPQRAAQVVQDFTALFGAINDYRLVPVTLWCRADEYPKGWFCDE